MTTDIYISNYEPQQYALWLEEIRSEVFNDPAVQVRAQKAIEAMATLAREAFAASDDVHDEAHLLHRRYTAGSGPEQDIQPAAIPYLMRRQAW